MDDVVKLICASSIFILFYSMVSKYIRDMLYIPDPFITLLFGIAIGHHGLNVLNTHYVYSKIIVLNFSRIVLCLQIMAISLKIKKEYLKTSSMVLFNLVVLGGFIKCFITFILIFGSTYLDVPTSWALAASLTPTDPILSSSIVSGEFAKQNVATKLKNILTTESGINDGLGIILVNISILLYSAANQTFGTKFKEFIINTVLIKVLFSILCGIVLGKIVNSCNKVCLRLQLLNSNTLIIQSFALTFLILSLMAMIDGSELICIFFTGIFLNEDNWYISHQSNFRISYVIENSFSMALFVFLGSRIDFTRFNMQMFKIIINAIFIRIITIIMLYRQFLFEVIGSFKEACFVGYFGPVGVGAIYYSLLYDALVDALTIDYAMCSVFVSVIIHGLSVPTYCAIKYILRYI